MKYQLLLWKLLKKTKSSFSSNWFKAATHYGWFSDLFCLSTAIIAVELIKCFWLGIMYLLVVSPRGNTEHTHRVWHCSFKFWWVFSPWGKYFHTNSPTLGKFPKISKQLNFKKIKLILQILHGSNHIQITLVKASRQKSNRLTDSMKDWRNIVNINSLYR